MKDQIPDQKLQKAVDILDQCMCAIQFYRKTKKDTYIDELTWAVKRLNQLLNEKGRKDE